MTDQLLPTGDGQTELSEEDRHGLIPTHIATRGELFEAEQRNIATGLLRRRPTVAQLLDDKFLRELHRAMFGEVWSWAGRYRTRETNIGIDPAHIAVAVRTLADDALAWVRHHASTRTSSRCDFTTAWSRSTRSRTATDVTAAWPPTI